MRPESLFERYRDLRDYVSWTEADEAQLSALAKLLEPSFEGIIQDFYREIQRHPDAMKVLTGGQEQIDRLKRTLLNWIRELFSGCYDQNYVERRWRVGLKHVEIGLDQLYCNVAMSRIRSGLIDALSRAWKGSEEGLRTATIAINKLLDLDLAIIEDAYQTERLARLQQMERLATLGQVSGGVAHELRNPLNVVKTSVYYLLNARNPLPEKRAEHLQRIERHVELADAVISALSNLAKMPSPETRPFLLENSIREVLALNPLPDTIAVSLVGLDRLPPVAADERQIQIVLANLIRNAREAMGTGGTLSLKGILAGPHVEIEVSDTGPGIPADQLARIMEPTYSTKARGLGLGLAISRSIVEKNQGELRVTSKPGQGTTFVIRLNAVPSPGKIGISP